MAKTIQPGKVRFLVVARDVRYFGEVHAAYETREEASETLTALYELGAGSGEIYACTMLSEADASFRSDD